MVSHIVCRTTWFILCCGLQLMMIASMISRELALGSEDVYTRERMGLRSSAASNCYLCLSR